jgi:hypothetical protein
MLDIVTVVANPIRWASRIRLARDAILDWLNEPNVRVTLVECTYGDRAPELSDLAQNPRVTFVHVKATTLVWNKENLMNIGISRLPHDARYIGTFDADIHFRKRGWAAETIHALQLHPVVQPWGAAYDLGPNDEHISTHTSFCRLFHEGQPVVATGSGFWKFDGGKAEYAHTGYAWAWTRSILDKIGGLFEVGGMGSGDHHMALAMVGNVEKSFPEGTSAAYRRALDIWQYRANAHINRNVGYVPGTIEHRFHGSKKARSYVGRWDIFVKHGFDPLRDLKRNSYGVVEWSGANPELEREWHLYLRSREEDGNQV